MASKDPLGDYLKSLEVECGRKADPYLPMVARLDGKCFSRFTKGLKRPYDERFVNLMVETTKYLVQESEALLGFCQSDEITLHWYLDKEHFSNREFWFDGRFQKIASVLASTAGSFFSANLPKYLPERVGTYPAFDCRADNLPSLEAVCDNYLWRSLDCQRNSVSMMAHHYFPHAELQNVSLKEMKELLRKNGTPWEEQPDFFRFGTYVARKRFQVYPDDESMKDIPEQYRPTGPITRTFVTVLDSLDDPRSFILGE